MKKEFATTILREEVSSCLLCDKCACTAACSHGFDCGRMLRAARFENNAKAAAMALTAPCVECEDHACMEACNKGKMDRPIRIPQVAEALAGLAEEPSFLHECSVVRKSKPSLEIDFMGVHFENPFCLSSSVVASDYDMIAKAFRMGWGSACFKTVGMSLLNDVSPRFSAVRKEANSFVAFKNIEQTSDKPLEENLKIIRRLKRDFPTKVIIASIMGQREDEWEYLAGAMQDAGADILELNFSCPHTAMKGLGSDVGQSMAMVAFFTEAVRRSTTLPILAKMTPNVGNMCLPALAAVRAGADGISAINTIKSLTDITLGDFASSPDVCGKSSVGGLSGKAVKPIAMRFIHEMATHPELAKVPLSGIGGIETWRDAVDYMALGCENVQVTTAVMQYGYRIIEDMIDGMMRFLAGKGMADVSELVGAALPNIVPTSELDYTGILYPKVHLDKCVGCGRCYLSCYDGGHQAIKMSQKTGKPQMNAKKCVGCHLCALVCPAAAIEPGKRIKRNDLIF